MFQFTQGPFAGDPNVESYHAGSPLQVTLMWNPITQGPFAGDPANVDVVNILVKVTRRGPHSPHSRSLVEDLEYLYYSTGILIFIFAHSHTMKTTGEASSNRIVYCSTA